MGEPSHGFAGQKLLRLPLGQLRMLRTRVGCRYRVVFPSRRAFEIVSEGEEGKAVVGVNKDLNGCEGYRSLVDPVRTVHRFQEADHPTHQHSSFNLSDGR